MRKILIILFILPILVSCYSKGAINVEQVEVNLPVILMRNSKNMTVRAIKFPLKLKIKNLSLKKRIFSNVRYYYHTRFEKNGWGWGAGFLYQLKDDNLVDENNSKWKIIKCFSPEYYVVYTSHHIDSSELSQVIFKPYLEQMKLLNQDTLAVSSIKDFKLKHREIVDSLLNRDTISIDFFDIRKGKPCYENIKIPVKG
ncbi:MAG: hypothetical protein COC06_10735 [Bacteroidales bacterium]|nr:MAG: hypothetical protein COC06_10735 [Bacteroidales bacterium]